MSTNKTSFLENLKTEPETDLKASINVVTVSNAIHFLLFAFYVPFIIYHYPFFYGYENIELVPSVFLDNRYSIFHIFLFIGLFRITMYILYQWNADLIHYSYQLFAIHKAMNIFYILFDIVYLVALLLFGWNHNSSSFPNNPANSDDYCKAYGNLYPEYCRTEDYIALNPAFLFSRFNFTLDFWFTVGFIIADIIQFYNARSLHIAISRSIFYQKSKNIINKTLEFEDIENSVDVITFFTFAHFAIWAVYIYLVVYGYGFFYGYENIERVPNAVFVDRRFGLFFILLFIQIFRIVLYVMYQWSADLIRYSKWIHNAHRGLNSFYFVFDIIYLVVLGVYGLLCNSNALPDNPCNDPIGYCKAYGLSHPTECRTEDYTGLSPSLLQENLSFRLDIFFTIGFFLFDIVQYFNQKAFHLSVVRFFSEE